MHLRFMMPWAIGAALGLWGMGCSSDEAPANVGGSSMQAGAAGQSSTGGGGASPGTGGQSATGGSATIDASPDVAAPASDAEIPKQEASTSDQRSSDATGPFALTSTAFKEGADVPVVYRCTDQNVSPPLSWTPGPAATQSYAVMMVHAAADMSIHWALWDIPASVTTLPMGVERVPNPTVPAGSKQAKPGIDGSTWSGYTGPCPGSANQKYEYAVYALDIATLPGVTVQSTTADVAAAVTAHQLPSARATLTGGASK
jgi:Raf kinase inhibitor-like YbhB/YbcL family protein